MKTMKMKYLYRCKCGQINQITDERTSYYEGSFCELCGTTVYSVPIVVSEDDTVIKYINSNTNEITDVYFKKDKQKGLNKVLNRHQILITISEDKKYITVSSGATPHILTADACPSDILKSIYSAINKYSEIIDRDGIKELCDNHCDDYCRLRDMVKRCKKCK